MAGDSLNWSINRQESPLSPTSSANHSIDLHLKRMGNLICVSVCAYVSLVYLNFILRKAENNKKDDEANKGQRFRRKISLCHLPVCCFSVEKGKARLKEEK